MTHPYQPSADEPQRWSLDKKAPGMFKNSPGVWVKRDDMLAWVAAEVERAVAAERERCVKVCREMAALYASTLKTPDLAKGAESCAVAVGNLAPRKTMGVSDGS